MQLEDEELTPLMEALRLQPTYVQKVKEHQQEDEQRTPFMEAPQDPDAPNLTPALRAQAKFFKMIDGIPDLILDQLDTSIC